MNTIRTLLVGLALLGALSLTAQRTQPGDIPGDILVMLTPGGSAQAIADDLRLVENIPSGMRVDHEVSAPMRIWLLKFDHQAVDQDRMLDLVKRHPYVMMAQNDHPVSERNVPNDPQYNQQWHHQNIASETAWQYSTGGITATGDTIVVCIIEGANTQHPDLAANRWFNHAEIPNNGIDDDGNGYVDDYRGWNPGGNNDNVYNGNHGTQVAGMIGAVGNNGLGMVGANWDVKMMVVTYASASQANVITAYTYPLTMRRRYNNSNGQQGAFVVATNASWGIDNANPDNYPLWCAIYDTLGRAGILNCGATANNNVDIDVVGDMPTACPSPFMVSVTATNQQDVRTFSGYGLTTIDVGAPGGGVFTTTGTNAYGSTSGTSFASPLTAGVIGLLYSAPCPTLMDLVLSDPQSGALYVRQMLFDGVDQVGNLPGQTVTGGRINAGNSMELIMAACGACPAPTGGSVSLSSATSATYTWNSFVGGPYTVRYRQQGATDWTEVGPLGDNTFTATGLQPCTPYEFQVQSECDGEPGDFGATALLTPPAAVTPVVFIDDFPVFCEGGSVTLSSSVAIGNTWSTGATSQSISVSVPGTYFVTADNGCEALTSQSITVDMLPTPEPPQAVGVSLTGPGSAQLSATGDNITWYDAPGGNVVGQGNTWETPFLGNSTTYYATSANQVGLVTAYGGLTTNSTSGQFHTNATFWLVFTANEPFTIRSVKVYANGAGARPIGLVSMPGGEVIQQGNFNIPDGESRVQLNFDVPGPGQYGLRVMSGNPQLWRDGTGSPQSYPYPLGTVGAITNSTATGANATAFYYFFYDWEVRTPGVACESEPVPVLVDITTGVEHITDGHGLTVFPVPADRDLFIDLSGPMAERTLQVEVLDATGRLTATKAMTGGRATLSTVHYADGFYVYRILDNGREVARGRFTVQHYW
jgi:hypothetical protein